MNLSLEKYIEIKVNNKEAGKKGITIKQLKKEQETLATDKKIVLEFLRDCIENKGNETGEITLNDLQKYISAKPEKTRNLNIRIESVAKKEQKQKGNYDEEEAIKSIQYSEKFGIYIILAIIMLFSLIFIPVGILLIINAILTFKISKKYNILTQKGVNEKEQWNALERYMKDFSLLKEKEIPSLVVWEKYLVFATAFGIADKVIEQLKLVYPEIQDMDKFSTYSCIYIMTRTDFNNSFTSAINSSMSLSMSSGSGRWWWFF